MGQTDVAANVRAEMARQRRRQSDLADHLGMARQNVSRRLLGRRPFDTDELAKVAEFLGVPITTFFQAGRENAEQAS